jgi:HSP20 family protein
MAHEDPPNHVSAVVGTECFGRRLSLCSAWMTFGAVVHPVREGTEDKAPGCDRNIFMKGDLIMTGRLIPWHTRTANVLDMFRREMDQWMNRLGNTEEGDTVSQFFSPETNLAETDKQYEITLDLPGLNPGDFNLEFDDGQLWITGERKQEKEEGKTYHRVERSYGKFRRGVSLGPDVDSEKIEATYRNGVLSVIVPKAPTACPKKIEVKG